MSALAALSSVPAAHAASTLFVRGGGYGHGIGMSQYGAYGYALHGEDYKFILAHYYQGTALGTTDPNQIVRVLLQTGSASFAGATAAVGPAANAKPHKLDPSLTYDVRALANGSIEVDRASKKVFTAAAPLTVTGMGPLTVAGLGQYRGALEFRPDGSGGVMTVNALDLEDYVRGVISEEMPASWAPEALKAQAVAARTYAITTNVGGSAFDQYSDTRSQMYGGVDAETPSTDAAVAATHGQIVTYNGAPAVTYFFSSSGGYTENVENVWPGATPDPWLRGVPDPYDGAGGNPYHQWGFRLTLGAAASKLGGLVRGQLIGIQVTQHGVSPRIMLAKVVGTGGSTTVTGGQLQSAFNLLSTYARFTTIVTLPGPASIKHRRLLPPVRLALQDAGAFRLVVRALAPLPPAIHGIVFPGRSGGPVTIQVFSHGAWGTLRTSRLAAGGVYSFRLPSAGTYRIVYRGLYGPAVTVA